MRAFIVVVLSSLFVVGVFAAPALKKSTKIETDITGEWSTKGTSYKGSAIDTTQDPGQTITFASDGTIYVVDPGNFPAPISASYTLDTKQNPPHIDIIFSPDPGVWITRKGIYRIDDDRLLLAIVDGDEERPTEFASAEGLATSIMVLERVKPK